MTLQKKVGFKAIHKSQNLDFFKFKPNLGANSLLLKVCLLASLMKENTLKSQLNKNATFCYSDTYHTNLLLQRHLPN